MKNMKIEINEQQPLDEVVAALESKGYKAADFTGGNFTHLVATRSGNYWFVNGITGILRSVKTTTLAELKEM